MVTGFHTGLFFFDPLMFRLPPNPGRYGGGCRSLGLLTRPRDLFHNVAPVRKEGRNTMGTICNPKINTKRGLLIFFGSSEVTEGGNSSKGLRTRGHVSKEQKECLPTRVRLQQKALFSRARGHVRSGAVCAA